MLLLRTPSPFPLLLLHISALRSAPLLRTQINANKRKQTERAASHVHAQDIDVSAMAVGAQSLSWVAWVRVSLLHLPAHFSWAAFCSPLPLQLIEHPQTVYLSSEHDWTDSV